MTLVVLVVGILLFIVKTIHNTAHKNEYLNLLSFTEWKTIAELMREMQGHKKNPVSYRVFYANIRKLEASGLVESRERTGQEKTVLEFRKTADHKTETRRRKKRPTTLIFGP